MRSTARETWLDEITVVHVEPCLADPSEWRLTARPDRDVTDVLPYLNAVLQGARYTHETKTLSLKKEGMLVTIMPEEVRLALVPSLDTGKALLEWLRPGCGVPSTAGGRVSRLSPRPTDASG